MTERYARIHTQLVDGGNYPEWAKSAGLPAVAAFWEYVRALAGGSGRAEFSLDDASAIFRRSVKTIQRWLTDGKRYGFFRDYRTTQGRVTVYHASLFRICQKLGLPSWGVVAEIPISDLGNAKLIATEVTTQQLQQGSRYLAQTEAKRNGFSSKLREPEKLLTSSETAPGALVQHISKTRIFVGERFIPYGVSQQKIAQNLGRHERTVRRRLSDSYRQAHGLLPVVKRQLCQTKPEYQHQYECAQFVSDAVPAGHRLFRLSGSHTPQTYRAECNLYILRHQLISCRVRRYRYKQELQLFPTNDSL